MPHCILEINARVWLGEQDWAGRSRPDLADVPTDQIKLWSDYGIDCIWLLGVWRKGRATREICLRREDIMENLARTLPDLHPSDVAGSPFSIVDYRLDTALGDSTTLQRLREKLNQYGIRLMLDFVPNHLAVDHPWVRDHPERFVAGTEVEMHREPDNYFQPPSNPNVILAHGRDPYFAGWTDTAQLNYFYPETREAMRGQLLKLAEVCDGVRCDMAMLVTNNVFKRTWGDISLLDYPDGDPPEFWKDAIAAVKAKFPDFVFVAEVYWDLERSLQTMGFDYTYDKTLYDRALDGNGAGILAHLMGIRDYWDRMLSFVENHDEARAEKAFGRRHTAAAVLCAATPGPMLLHEGQCMGRAVHVPVQLTRRPQEPVNESVKEFYDRLLKAMNEPAMREGVCQVLDVWHAWEGNESYRGVVALWRAKESERRLVIANVADYQAQAYVRLPVDGMEGDVIELRDLVGEHRYTRARHALEDRGLYVDMGAGGYHVFRVENAPAGAKPDDLDA